MQNNFQLQRGGGWGGWLSFWVDLSVQSKRHIVWSCTLASSLETVWWGRFFTLKYTAMKQKMAFTRLNRNIQLEPYIHQDMYPVPFTLYSIHCTLYPVPCTLYHVYCTLYPVLYTLYPVYCTNRKKIMTEESARTSFSPCIQVSTYWPLETN